jgi:hypothetical protein
MQATSVSTSTLSNKVEPTPPPEAEFEFSDVTALMCLLCARQFKSLDQLKRHNNESDLHKARNLNVVFPPQTIKLTLSFVLLSSLFWGKNVNSLIVSLECTEKLQGCQSSRGGPSEGSGEKIRLTTQVS